MNVLCTKQQQNHVFLAGSLGYLGHVLRKALKYLPSTSTDIAERELARSYASFALPQKSEGFEKVEP